MSKSQNVVINGRRYIVTDVSHISEDEASDKIVEMYMRKHHPELYEKSVKEENSEPKKED